MTSRRPPSDRDGRGANFGCGFLVGALAVAGSLLTSADWPIVVGSGVGAGLLAVLFGDRFWTSMVRWLG